MAKFTLFELHIDGVELTAPEFGSDDDGELESTESGSRLGTALLAVGAIAVLAVITVVIKKRLGGSEDEPSIDLDE